MIRDFYKYQGTGNDFIMIDDRESVFPVEDQQYIERLCHRRFGIGADGLILIQSAKDYDFEMVYFNSDGRLSSMCGNGGRCAAAFAKFLGLSDTKTKFLAADGEHQAIIAENAVSLQMKDVGKIKKSDRDYILDTGSPHYVIFTQNVKKVDVMEEGQNIRYSEDYERDGINVNFVQILGDSQIQIRTYERGVEGETYSCGTGATASALAFYDMHYASENGSGHIHKIEVITEGGSLFVSFIPGSKGKFSNVWLIGPAVPVFFGQVLK